eukprot:scaffold40423_cov57-Phaeocystis_antarctica.AAC.2
MPPVATLAALARGKFGEALRGRLRFVGRKRKPQAAVDAGAPPCTTTMPQDGHLAARRPPRRSPRVLSREQLALSLT